MSQNKVCKSKPNPKPSCGSDTDDWPKPITESPYDKTDMRQKTPANPKAK